MGDFKKLKVWEFAKDNAVRVYAMTDKYEFLKKDFRLKDQLRSSAVSIASNIAEGDELKTHKQCINHFYIAKGSCAELITQLIIVKEISKEPIYEINELIKHCEYLSLMLHKLITVRNTF